MLKKYFLASCIACILFSCAKDNYPETPEVVTPEKEAISYSDKLIKNINVHTEVNTVNIFKETLVGVYDEENHKDYRSFIDWDNVFVDSVVWHIDDVLHYNTRTERNLAYRGITFNKPGNYEFNLLLYKDSKVIKRSSLTFRAIAGKDFFNVNWENPPASNIVGQSYSYKKGYRIDQTYVKGQYPYSYVSLYYGDQFPKQTPEKGKEYLMEVAQTTFGTPKFVSAQNKQAELDEKYIMLFKNKLNYTPVAIWENGASSIALVGSPKDAIETYFIIAEPKY
ncbi:MULTISPECIES: hypothetical protein [Sphingobacterium]|uniref:Uncharacterized protein n=1 Tax=Sphingobacterium athyrii TaxID=2152717 RepID=A0A363NSB2_9SPHI|nr:MULTISPECIES: hypothetical protein [Sphingobacterium]PUV23695.1 hypothetical protein DCO56_17575 [Sphingobacterium athyrii]QIH36275.1 hypothetical protein G6053_26880 [Sphingobacterium sp. DR205]